jgi:hypothetical protein
VSAPAAWSAAGRRARSAAAGAAGAARLPAGRPLAMAGRTASSRGLVVVLLAVAANWLLWASAVPFGEAPDEPSHLEVAQLVAARGRLPTFGPGADQYVRLDQVGIPIESHALAPPLPYLVDGALIRWLPIPPLAAARLGSLGAALVAVGLSYWLARLALGGRPSLVLAVAALVAVVPEVSFLAAVVNSDVFALAAALAAGCLWPRARQPLGALVFGGLGLVVLAKYTAYPVAALALLAAGWQLGKGIDRHGAVVRLMLVALGAGLVAGPWLAHNWALYGQPWPLGVSEAAFRALTPAVPVEGAPGSQRPLSVEYARSWWEITFRSFWAGFGRVDLFAPTWCYAAIVGAIAVGLGGLARVLARPVARAWLGAALRRPAGLLLVGWPLAVGLAVSRPRPLPAPGAPAARARAGARLAGRGSRAPAGALAPYGLPSPPGAIPPPAARAAHPGALGAGRGTGGAESLLPARRRRAALLRARRDARGGDRGRAPPWRPGRRCSPRARLGRRHGPRRLEAGRDRRPAGLARRRDDRLGHRRRGARARGRRRRAAPRRRPRARRSRPRHRWLRLPLGRPRRPAGRPHPRHLRRRSSHQRCGLRGGPGARGRRVRVLSFGVTGEPHSMLVAIP